MSCFALHYTWTPALWFIHKWSLHVVDLWSNRNFFVCISQIREVNSYKTVHFRIVYQKRWQHSFFAEIAKKKIVKKGQPNLFLRQTFWIVKSLETENKSNIKPFKLVHAHAFEFYCNLFFSSIGSGRRKIFSELNSKPQFLPPANERYTLQSWPAWFPAWKHSAHKDIDGGIPQVRQRYAIVFGGHTTPQAIDAALNVDIDWQNSSKLWPPAISCIQLVSASLSPISIATPNIDASWSHSVWNFAWYSLEMHRIMNQSLTTSLQ